MGSANSPVPPFPAGGGHFRRVWPPAPGRLPPAPPGHALRPVLQVQVQQRRRRPPAHLKEREEEEERLAGYQWANSPFLLISFWPARAESALISASQGLLWKAVWRWPTRALNAVG